MKNPQVQEVTEYLPLEEPMSSRSFIFYVIGQRDTSVEVGSSAITCKELQSFLSLCCHPVVIWIFAAQI